VSVSDDLTQIERFIASLLAEFPGGSTGFESEVLDEWTFVVSTSTSAVTALPLQDSDYLLLGLATAGGTAMVATTNITIATFTSVFRWYPEVLLFCPATALQLKTRVPIAAKQQIYVSTSTQGQATVYLGRRRLAST